MKYAIIGAGVTGSLLAQKLLHEGHHVEVFEKSRGRGGRCCYKRTSWGAFDMGAMVVPASDPAFIAFMNEQRLQGNAEQWPHSVHDFNEQLSERQDKRHYYSFAPGMNAGCRAWLAGVELHNSVRIKHLQKVREGWLLWDEDEGKHGVFDYVVSTIPWPQTVELLSPWAKEKALTSLARDWTSCWSVAFAFEHSIDTDVNLLYVDSGPLQALSNQSSKPGSDSETPVWVAQLANDFSDQHSDSSPGQIADIALTEMTRVFGLLPKVEHTYTHFWRYARPKTGQSHPGVFHDPDSSMLAGGDWSFGGSVQSAFKAANTLFELIS